MCLNEINLTLKEIVYELRELRKLISNKPVDSTIVHYIAVKYIATDSCQYMIKSIINRQGTSPDVFISPVAHARQVDTQGLHTMILQDLYRFRLPLYFPEEISTTVYSNCINLEQTFNDTGYWMKDKLKPITFIYNATLNFEDITGDNKCSQCQE